ncbi:MAG: trigger factor [Holophagales bacterium]|jgi:trigger factor|nr:trigger factor [Holophagales bacterium]
MQVTLTHNSATRKSVEIIFPAPLVEKAFGAAIADITPKVKLPGFRPGKTPKSILISKFQHEINREVSEKLIESHFWDAISSIGLQPISRPAVEKAELREGAEGKIKLQFDVAPEVRLPDYKSAVLVKKKRRVDDENISEILETMRNKAARLVPVEGGAEIGHIVSMELKVKPQGMKPRHLHDQEIQLEEGKPFDRELLGLKADEIKKFTIQFSEDDKDRGLAGKQVNYEVMVTAINAEVLPELNDEFAKDESKCESLEALREQIRRVYEEEAERDAMARLQSDLLDQLLDASNFEVPSSMINLQLDDYCREFSEKLSQRDISSKRVNWAEYRRHRLVDAERAVRSGYLLQALGNAEDIQVSDEEIDSEIRKWMEETKTTRSFENIKADFEKHGAATEIRGRVRTEKIFDMLLKTAAITEELLDTAAYAELLEVERRREEGIAQVRFDAGGLEGGDFEEQEGGGPEAIKPAEEAAAPEPLAIEEEPTKTASTVIPESAESESKNAPAAVEETLETDEAPLKEASAASVKSSARRTKAAAPKEPETEEAPKKAVSKSSPRKTAASDSDDAVSENEAKPKRGRKKAESES